MSFEVFNAFINPAFDGAQLIWIELKIWLSGAKSVLWHEQPLMTTWISASKVNPSGAAFSWFIYLL